MHVESQGNSFWSDPTNKKAAVAQIAGKAHAGYYRKVLKHKVHHSLLHIGLHNEYPC